MKYLDLLGYPVTDSVTGFKGIVESISYDLYGCIQAVVRGPVNDKGEIPDGRWFDCKRLSKSQTEPVMRAPIFETAAVYQEAGPAEKPAR